MQLVPCWHTGNRDLSSAKIYIDDVADRLANPETRYSPGKFVEAKCGMLIGNPDKDHISTNYVERQNLTMRMSMRRFTRLTNSFSKKVEIHMYSISLHFMYYNFCRIHKTLEVTPAMEAGIAESVYDLDFIVELIGEAAPAVNKRGFYKRKNSG